MIKTTLGVSLVAALLALGACASGRRGVRAESSEPALLAHSGAFELHVRDGRVVQVIPAPDGTRVRRVEDEDELRRLYAEAAGTPLPVSGDGTVSVNGWVGLECVRAGHACGRAPEDAPRVMILVRFN